MDLESVYRAAIYRVESPSGAFELQVGASSAALQAVAGDGPWVLITAWNPGSERRAEEENLEAQQRLAVELRALGAVLIPAEGRSPDGSWREPSFLALGLSEDQGLRLARVQGQRAILCGQGAGPVRLVFA